MKVCGFSWGGPYRFIMTIFSINFWSRVIHCNSTSWVDTFKGRRSI